MPCGIVSRLRAASLPFVVATVLSAQTPVNAPPASSVDVERALRTLQVLSADSMEGREANTDGSARAQRFLVAEFTRVGVQPLVPKFAAPFDSRAKFADSLATARPSSCAAASILGRRAPCPTPQATYRPIHGVNLLGVVKGTVHADRYIVVSAHYDHLGIKRGQVFNGADDNASGVAAVLAIAEWTAAHPPENSIIFALFDAEEFGMLGSTEFLRSPPVPLKQIFADVNADMISRGDGDVLYAVGASLTPAMSAFVDSVQGVASIHVERGHDVPGNSQDWTRRTDTAPFRDRGIAIIDFSNDEHVDYHRQTDTFERVRTSFFVGSVRVMAAYVRQLDHGLDAVVGGGAARR